MVHFLLTDADDGGRETGCGVGGCLTYIYRQRRAEASPAAHIEDLALAVRT